MGKHGPGIRIHNLESLYCMNNSNQKWKVIGNYGLLLILNVLIVPPTPTQFSLIVCSNRFLIGF